MLCTPDVGGEGRTSIDSDELNNSIELRIKERNLLCTAFVEKHQNNPSLLKQMKQVMFHIGHGDIANFWPS